MIEDFVLSERIVELKYDEEGVGDDILRFNDVKEFIKRLKEEFKPISAIYNDDFSHGQNIICIRINEFIDKLAGDKLI